MKGKKWNIKEIQILKKKYPNTSINNLSNIFNRTKQSIYDKARFLKIKKDPSFISSEISARQKKAVANGTHKGGFLKGHIPANKGKPMSEELKKRISKTLFKKGIRPHNYLEVGTIILESSGYKKIKIAAPDKWEFLHRYNWKKCFGDIPKNYILIFNNKIKTDCKIENLKLIKMSDNMLRNTIQNYPKEIQQLIKIISKFKKQIKKIEHD